jgi:membrane protease YdiL (CAAX protease family)
MAEGFSRGLEVSAAICGVNSQFSVRNAWKCLGLIFLLYVLTSILVPLGWPIYPTWFRSNRPIRVLILRILEFLVMFVPMVIFIRPKSLSEFIQTFGLNLRPSKELWLAIIYCVVIQALAFVTFHFGMPNRGLNPPDLKTATALETIWYFLPFLAAPFWEELLMRGFFYRAFRQSYSKLTSILIVVGITALTHSSQFFGSMIAALGLTVFVIIMCWLMEKTNRIWNCIFAHLAFNALFILTCYIPR